MNITNKLLVVTFILFMWIPYKKYILIISLLLLTSCSTKPDINKIMYACDSEIAEYKFSSEQIRLEFKCKGANNEN
jgi:hypothetical protein